MLEKTEWRRTMYDRRSHDSRDNCGYGSHNYGNRKPQLERLERSGAHPCHVRTEVRKGGDVRDALKVFRREVEDAEVLTRHKELQFFEPKSVKRRREKAQRLSYIRRAQARNKTQEQWQEFLGDEST